MTTRCPHCASPKIDGTTCRACGRSIEEAADLPRLEGIEVTQLEPRVLPKRAVDNATTRKVCAKCSVPNPSSRVLCLACGERL